MKNSEQLTPAAAAITALSTLLCCIPVSFAAAVATTSVGLFVASHQGWFLAASVGLRISESPIIFIERREGASKLSSGILFESLLTPWRLVVRHGRLRSPAAEAAGYNSGGASR